MKWKGRRESRNVIDYRDYAPHLPALSRRELIRRANETMNRGVTAPELGKKYVEGMRKIEAEPRAVSHGKTTRLPKRRK